MKRKLLLLSVTIFLLIAPIAIKANYASRVDYTCVACLAEASDQGAAAYENCMNIIGDDALCQQQMWWVACTYGQGHCAPCQGTVDMCGRVGGRGPMLP